ncbi:MAG: alpha/beta hydrolase [Rhodospirillaceae bacterium]|jgi:pimeloyl-ACP methyl ester carboxylesterase|nr:alpha/beta hydrolase [Rhodospirillaceae bacterium]MBT5944146.1 alpha/beta hydrolase [Rhodospirillaceae bacterium]MBT6405327.1 alpha/beta hydrolase [Rhodospirillaceae bacterium]MBT6537715.1 alpha/beta hydrolase [Rhodospirillaceae bacterium]MBT7361122.1 alpha/beta hydrolase [Rhodospirillaceae bacterium]
MRSRSFRGLSQSGFHRLHYTEWGEPDAPVVLCVHGLTQTARSFDRLAETLAADRRVICLDVVGRGRSGWLADPSGYDFPQYLADVNALLARLGVDRIDFVGTSMGGIIGMLLAALPDTPIRKLVVNDVGPFIPKAALEWIRDYVGTDPEFPDLASLEAYLRQIWAPFGNLDDGEWAHLAETSARRADNGSFALAYDPAIAVPMKASPVTDVNLWPVWDEIACDTLLVRGAQSLLLPGDTAREMTGRGPCAELIEIADVGHAPTFSRAVEIEPVAVFLRK